MRYLWDLYPAYRNEWTHSRWKRAIMTPLANYLRLWDYASAARVDDFIANSENVRRRIQKTYRRDSLVVPPPVAVETFYWKASEDYYLIVSELVAYKRLDSAIRAFSASGRKLRVVGDGPEFQSLSKPATANVEFCGRVSDSDLRELYARCRAFLMPGEEDFGIIPVEAQSEGTPVLALGRGGVRESIATFPHRTGMFFSEPNAEAIAACVRSFVAQEHQFSRSTCRAQANQFSAERFRSQFKTYVDREFERNRLPNAEGGLKLLPSRSYA